MIADWLSSTGLAAAKPAIAALVLPPVPLLLLALLGAWRARRGRRAGAGLAFAAVLGLWLCGCEGFADWLQRGLLRPPPALSAQDRAALKARAAGGGLAIVVLGGGVARDAAEYGADDLRAPSLQRLRYGLWLGRETGIPVAMSGGTGWASPDGRATSEAAVGARIAAQEFGAPLRWTETRSRDTRENALEVTTLLTGQGIHEIVLVTHGWHMPRALREFRAAAARPGISMRVDAAPLDLAPRDDVPRWVPSGRGTADVSTRVHELLGWMLAPAART
jgi:uncharacterized SAM-binding protein YcdF (DUF218 family)